MTIRKSGSRRTTSNSTPAQHRMRLQKKRRESVRRTLLESLEQRQLMAVGPTLTGIQPNDGELLFDVRQLAGTSAGSSDLPVLIQGNTLTVSPREFVFRFNGDASIDANTLDGIRITRAGADGDFERALATTDFGTQGAALVEFRSAISGAAGNGQQLRFTSVNRTGTNIPIIRLNGDVLEIELNSNPLSPTRIQELENAIRNSSIASERVVMSVISGPTLTPIGTTTGNRTLTLQGANAAVAVSELGTTNGTLVRLIAVAPGPEGRGISISLVKRNFGGPANPVVTVQGKAIQVQVNSTPGFESTVNDFLNALNSNPQSAAMVTSVLESGSGATSLAGLPNNFAPLVLSGAGDEILVPGYVGLGDSAREIIFRFNENLPDDRYRIDILGSGAQMLTDVSGDPFNDGRDMGIEFNLNLGPRVVAVVPEPVKRNASGQLTQAAGTIEVHFNDDDLSVTAAQNPAFYQLVFRSVNGTDVIVNPTRVTYSSITNIATLQFAAPLSRLVDPNSATGAFLQGAFRLRVGTSEGVSAPPTEVVLAAEPADNFEQSRLNSDLTNDLGSLVGGTRSLIINGSIENQADFPFEMPGSPDTLGRREIRPEDISRFEGPLPLDYYRLDTDGDLRGDADSTPGITEFVYAFPNSYQGPDPTTGGATQKTYFNVITEEQKQRVREVMSMFSEYLGVQFIERLTDDGDPLNDVTRIVVGDLYSANGDADSGQGGTNDIVAAFRPDGVDANSFPDYGVLDFQNFDEADDDRFGGEFSRGAMLLIGQLLGYGYGDDLPQPVSQSSTFVLNPGSSNEATYPSVVDILHGQYLYRPESSDIDLYSFTLDEPGQLTAETFAERADSVSLLNTALRLYKLNEQTNQYEEIAANDDYNSNDSLLEMSLGRGTYALGVSASGNTTYDPTIPGTGFGGLSEGEYQLRLTVRPNRPQGLVDSSPQRLALDGDGDGRPGGVFEFWYEPAEALNPSLRNLEIQAGGAVTPATIFVDKMAAVGGVGSLASPFNEIDLAIAASRPGDIIRIVANGGADGRISTPADNRSYQIGVDNLGRTLADGRSLEVPKGVTMVIDAGAILKFRNSHVTVGSNAVTVDRSGSALQVLGTPIIIEANGQIATDAQREPIPGSVYFTSYNDATLGAGNSPTNLFVQAGDWGGIDFRGELDTADETRENLEAQGIFLNQIYHADIRYGGGQVSVAGQPLAIAPIEIDVTRPTVAYSKISRSAGPAIEATPDSFVESTFMEYVAPGEVGFTPDYSRVGPDIYGNRIIDNSINGMLIRTTTRTGESVETLKVQARFDDLDVVHVVTENLIIEGTPGGPVIETFVPPSLLIQTTATAGGFLAPATYVYRLSYVDVNGNETPASNPTVPQATSSVGSVTLTQLPTLAPGSGFVSRRLYRATVDAAGNVGTFRLAGVLNGGNTTFVDNGTLTGATLVDRPLQLRSRQDARLTIDPGVIVKLDGARIETTFGGTLLAEAAPSLPIIMTGLNDNRYGAGGTFKTDAKSEIDDLIEGAWGGIYVGYGTSASLDNVRIAGAGGITRIEGGFASFNAIEVHQADFRMANSRLEMNSSGAELPDSERGGRGSNVAGTLFVRGANPTIINNTFVDGAGPAITIDINSLGFQSFTDPGRSIGGLDRLDARGNVGPLVRGNTLDGNDLNGMHVRGGETTTEVVFDDADIVHIVLDTIEIPNQHIFGGLRLQSSPDASLVVKFESRNNEVAGIVVGGTLLTSTGELGAIDDRIGGSLVLVGAPDFPVVLTTLADDSVGAGFTLAGQPQTDTNNDGLFGAAQPTIDGFAQLPFGPEINRGLTIDNDVSVNIPGFFQAEPVAGGNLGTSIGAPSGVTVNATGGILIDQDYIFEFLNMIDVGGDGDAISLENTTITQQPRLIADDRVQSRGTFQGENGLINWTVDTYFLDGVPVLFNSITFESTATLGDLRLISYLDEDVEAVGDDILFTTGTPGEADFRAFTVDGARRIGFAQGGYYDEDGVNLQNAVYTGWAADIYRDLLDDIEGPGVGYTIPGNINLANLPQGTDAQFGTIFGPGDVTTAFAWDVLPNAFSATITSFLELVPRDPAAASAQVESGLWQGVTIREGASDRNVLGAPEYESPNRTADLGNAVPGSAQYLGELAGESRGGDENQRLGFVIDGYLAERNDIDVYSFVGRAGSEVWIDVDRTDMTLDSVVELIDANGNVIASSDNSAEESLDPSKIYRGSMVNADSVNPMNSLPLAEQTLTAAQDAYSSNPKDAGFRIVLPGDEGTRNLYHVRVRSSNDANGDITPVGGNVQLVGAGLTFGAYRLQMRLREADEFPGTQVRIGDVRYARTNLQVIGQPFHSPLLGEGQETSGDNNTRANAQPIGPFSLGVNAANPAAANIVASDRNSLSIGGDISAADDVDWFQFDINYQNLPAGTALQFLSTVFDIDYADGFARADLSLYVFDSAGRLILIGNDSNIAEDQPRPNQGTDSSDLSRGSAGTNDPFIGAAELASGRYFVAVSNNTQIPVVLNPLYTASTNPAVSIVDPNLRIEPLPSIRRVAEDRIEGGTNQLFNGQSFVPYTLDDMVLYSLATFAGNTRELTMSNPFNGTDYGSVGASAAPGGGTIRDMAVHGNGELLAFRHGNVDAETVYVRISSETGVVTDVGPIDIVTEVGAPGVGFRAQALALLSTFPNQNLGLVIGNRGTGTANGPAVYDQNILYLFNSATGTAISDPAEDGETLLIGSRTTKVERGFINTSRTFGSINAIDFQDATFVDASGNASFRLFDGMGFTFTASDGVPRRFEFNTGPDFRMSYNPAGGIFVRDGDRITVNGLTYEFDTGGAINVTAGSQVAAGATITLTSETGIVRTFEMTTSGNAAAGNVPVTYSATMTATEVAAALSAAIAAEDFGVTPEVLGTQGVIVLSGDSTSVAPVVSGSGVSFVGGHGTTTGTVLPIRVEENVSYEQFVAAIASSLQGDVAVGVAGNRVNFRGAVAANDFSSLRTRGIIIANAGSADGSFGNGSVSANSIGIDFLASDTAEVIAQRVEHAVNQAALGVGNAIADADANRRTVTFSNVTFAANGIDGSAGNAAFRLQNVAPGGTVTGLAFLNDDSDILYAVSSTGGLYVVNNPLEGNSRLASAGIAPGAIGSYVRTASDLRGINFTSLASGPDLLYVDTWTVPGTSTVQSMSNLLFGADTAGNLFAFNTRGELQPIFEGGATSISTGRFGTDGIILSTNNTNLWRNTGSELALNITDTFRPRLDGQPVTGTINRPGGASGALETNEFSLVGYTAADQPYLYFDYNLGTDGVDGLGGDQDALHVYVMTADGQSTLVATNNLATAGGTNDDPLDNVTGAQVMPLFDNVGERQARVPLAAFAGQDGLKLRIEFAAAGQMTNGTIQLRTGNGSTYADGDAITIGGQVFELDYGPTMTLASGTAFVDFYDTLDGGVAGSQPDSKVTVVVDGRTFVLSDGLRNIAADEVEVLLAIADDPATPEDESKSIEELTSVEVADLLRQAILANRPEPTVIPGVVDFSVEPNDDIGRAVRLPRGAADTDIRGTGRIGTIAGDQLNDVDFTRISLFAGERLTVDVTRLTGGANPIQPQIKFFNSEGRELAATSGGGGNALLTYVAPEDMEVFIGINSASDYNPLIPRSSQPLTGGGTYSVDLTTRMEFDVVQMGNKLQVLGVAEADSSEATLIAIDGALGVGREHHRIPVRIDMSNVEVATAIRAALVKHLSNGVAVAFPRYSNSIELGTWNINDAGPFQVIGDKRGDQFGSLGPGRARANTGSGVVLDDFIIGFAERGEIVLGASETLAGRDTFGPNQQRQSSNPPAPGSDLVTGAYQLEIRDGSEYLRYNYPADVDPFVTLFRQFDTNDRLAEDAVHLVAPSPAVIVDGMTFSINDSVRRLTFEFDLEGSKGGVAPGNVRIPFNGSDTSDRAADRVAQAITDAINSAPVQALLKVSALVPLGADGNPASARVELFGSVVLTDDSGVLQIVNSAGRGDSNRELDDQGVIIIESSSFSFAAEYGIDLNHSGSVTIDGQTSDNLVRYPRNLVELNTNGQIPGVVVQSNVVAYNRLGAIRINGLADTGANVNPVPVDRIVNNTLVGGRIDRGESTPGAVFQGLLFNQGTISFADRVENYNPNAGGGPAPTAEFRNQDQALGAPDGVNIGTEPADGSTTVSLGYGGTLTVQFVDNLLTADGTAAPDLVIFEVGAIESVQVEVSRDGNIYFPVGTVGGLVNRVDLDQFGFTPQDRLSFVRLTDARQGDRASLSVGADIDAIGALSTVPADVYTAGGTGIEVNQNAAPTLMNNVIANFATGVAADVTSGGTVSGANSFYRNGTDLSGNAVFGQASQRIRDAAHIFVAAPDGVFDPAAGSPLIDSSIDSLLDRPVLATVRQSIGLELSPILAPRLDVHGQLRVDDPNVDSPSGVGENVFKDRGAADRSDQAGPVARLVLPADNDPAGIDANRAANVVTLLNGSVEAFEIRLLDGVAPSDPVPGTGIADGSVTSESVIVLRDNIPLVEGIDYNFAYQASSNTIRLTPLAGLWQEDAVYTIRLLDSNDSVIVAADGDQYRDGELINLIDRLGNLTVLEVEMGILLEVPTNGGEPVIGDGTSFTIFDGDLTERFEFDNNNATGNGTIVIPIRDNMTLTDVVQGIATAINGSGLAVSATASDGAVVQLTGSNILSTVDPFDSGLTVNGQFGVSAGYGFQIPSLNGQPDGLVDGQTFAIRRGPFQVINFEVNTTPGLNNPGFVPVNIPAGASIDAAATAFVNAIGGAGLGLSPINVGFGRVALNGDASYSIDPGDTVLQVLGVPGQIASVPLPISVDPDETALLVAQDIANLINAQNLPDITTSVIGPRVIVNNVVGISGTGAISLATIRDRVGNLLQSNQDDGTTTLTIFVGSGYDYGDAPEPKYASLEASNGPRHKIVQGLSLGDGVTADANAVPNDGDVDDGVTVLGAVYTGFDLNLSVDITADNGPFVLDVFVDWNGDGTFEQHVRRTSASGVVSAGTNNLQLAVPSLGTAAEGRDLYSVAGPTFARFRLSSAGVDSPLGDAVDGEVEDIGFTINVNPFQNPSLRWDVNASGDVSPIDILQVINALNRSGGTQIILDPANPTETPPFLDVNGDGLVQPIDALAVLNYIENVVLGGRGRSGGEGEGRSYVATGNGVYGSLATIAGEGDLGAASLGAGPQAWSFNSGLVAEGEGTDVGANQFVGRGSSSQTENVGGSIFESAPALAMEELFQSLAEDTAAADSAKLDDPAAALDALFSEMGR